jgi:hypothetical protein
MSPIRASQCPNPLFSDYLKKKTNAS